MATYRVGIAYERYGHIEVEADSEEEAIEKAQAELDDMTIEEMDEVTDYLEDSEEIDKDSVEEIDD